MPARPQDVAQVLSLPEAAAAWMTSRGLRQWEPGEVTVDDVRRQVQAKEWHVLRDGNVVVAGLRLLWQDEFLWGKQPPIAGYVHGLVVDRRLAGQGVGAGLLQWAGRQVLTAGRTLLRLDCVETNSELRCYYERHGFQVVGQRNPGKPGWHAAVLLEKEL